MTPSAATGHDRAAHRPRTARRPSTRGTTAGVRRPTGAAAAGTAAALTVALVLAGCTADAGTPDPTGTAAPPPGPSGPTPAVPTPTTSPVAWPAGPDVAPATATPQDVVTDLAAPWGLAFLPGGAVVLTLRDRAEVALLTADGLATLGGPGAEDLAATTRTGGEGGLLGVAASPTVETDRLLYLYRTAADGNQVVRTTLDAATGSLGALEPVLTGIPAAGNHNGGRIAFGPDGHLYVATGDAGDRPSAQDPASLAGKILRVTADGEPAPGNPTPGSPVWSLGHRNVQGLAWDDEGLLFASEFGQDTLDELNVVVPGGNYGWPEVEGAAEVAGFVDPVAEWHPDDASPSGVAALGDTVYVAALRGQRLLSVPFPADDAGEPGEALVGELGRLRHVAAGPDGALWVLTNNTDGRGSPRPGDDRLVRVAAP
jgi:glucose/arabinose dehydrogenase